MEDSPAAGDYQQALIAGKLNSADGLVSISRWFDWLRKNYGQPTHEERHAYQHLIKGQSHPLYWPGVLPDEQLLQYSERYRRYKDCMGDALTADTYVREFIHGLRNRLVQDKLMSGTKGAQDLTGWTWDRLMEEVRSLQYTEHCTPPAAPSQQMWDYKLRCVKPYGAQENKGNRLMLQTCDQIDSSLGQVPSQQPLD
jgi:hypothetical protein